MRDRRKRHIVGDDIEHILSEEQIIRTSGGSITAVPQEHREESFIDFNKGDAFKEFNLPPGKTLHGNYYRDLVVISFNPNAYHFKEVHQTKLLLKTKIIQLIIKILDLLMKLNFLR